MPDISMCKNEQCPLKKICYRYTAKPSSWQFYGQFEPDEKGECKHYLEIEQNEKRTEEKS